MRMTTAGSMVVTALAAVLLVVLTSIVPGPVAAEAQSEMLLGLDMQPVTNGSNELGRLQPCTEAEIGAEFSADVFIANVPSLIAWELRLDYDPGVVSIELADYNQMLLSAQPSGTVFPALLELEQAGRHFMAATEINGTPDYGSGVLAHLTMRAVGPGESLVSIVGAPTTHGPRITGAGGSPIGDDTGDGIWDGQLTSGMVRVGGDCPQATPIPTPVPTSGGGSPGNGGSAGNGSTSDSSSGSASGGAVAVVGSGDPGEGADNGEGSSSGNGGLGGNGPSEPLDGSGASSSDDDISIAGDGEDGGDDGSTASGTDGDDGGGLGQIPLVIGILGISAVVLGAGTLFVFRRRGTW